MILYRLHTRPSTEGYTVTKFDDDLNPTSSYTFTEDACPCPRGQTGKMCRHRQMLATLLARVNTPWFYDWDGQSGWHDPTGEARLAQLEAEEAARAQQPGLLEALEASGLRPIVIDEHTDIPKALGAGEGAEPPSQPTEVLVTRTSAADGASRPAPGPSGFRRPK